MINTHALTPHNTGAGSAARTQIEWESELAVVIGRTASRVPVERAADYIFGFTLENDISDRGGRGDTRYGSDWLVTKNATRLHRWGRSSRRWSSSTTSSRASPKQQ